LSRITEVRETTRKFGIRASKHARIQHVFRGFDLWRPHSGHPRPCLSFRPGCDLRRLENYCDRLELLAEAFLRIAYRNDGCIAALADLDGEQIVSTFGGIVFAKTTAQTPRFYPDRCINRRVILGSSLKHIDCNGVLFGRRVRQRLLDNIRRKAWLRVAAEKTFDLRMRSTCSVIRIGSICVSSVRMKVSCKWLKELTVRVTYVTELPSRFQNLNIVPNRRDTAPAERGL
jgi:hypothetical protein